MTTLILVGDRAFAEVAHEYFTHDSDYEVVAFSVEREFMRSDSFRGLPMVPFESLEEHYDPAEHHVYVAITYLGLNRVRTRLADEAQRKGFALASYISSHAFVWHNAEIGEHCFIFEHNRIQPFATIGRNVVLWSGNHIGHHARVGDNCFITSGVGVSGGAIVGNNGFMAGHSGVANDIEIGDDCWIGPMVPVLQSLEPDSFVTPARTTRHERGARSRFLL
jgi:sugar O-acyltransferase (sialic acid O-acetyltransferase NeuD family)